MEGSRTPLLPSDLPESTSSNNTGSANFHAHGIRGWSGIQGLKKRGHGSRSWIQIDPLGNTSVVELDKATIMRHCSLPARDLRLLDPLFIYPSTILGREKAIVVSLEQIRCIITADEVILMNSLDGCVVQYKSELCKRLQSNKDQSDDLPFEFRALELALELTCSSLDAQVKELAMEIYPVLDELALSINTLNLERVRRLKGHLLAVTQRVQKLKEYIDDTEDLINFKLGNVQNHLIQFELLLTAATFVATIFAAVTAVFGMNFPDSIFDNPSTFSWVLIICGVACGFLYFSFLLYFRYKRIFPL
ncbi:hypothetical protein PRUPE_1G287300 [Prunus persica]|uniref:Magnesium transporter n=1 Tax=Prunus persica TaxID=3760 RepID=A0A251R4Q5_PRUPE|nr:hypothetical protein PRUPE_1G287300 [Prunus persica]